MFLGSVKRVIPPAFEPLSPGLYNVTPADMDPNTGGTNYFGCTAQPVQHPIRPNLFYIACDKTGIWRSDNYCKPGSWTKISAPGSAIEAGAIWYLAINILGDTLLAGQGHEGSTTSILISREGVGGPLGRHWQATPDLGFQPYNADFHPTEPYEAILSSHTGSDANIYRSQNLDAAINSIAVSSIGSTGLSNSSYAYYLGPDRIIALGEGDDAVTNRCVTSDLSAGIWGSFTVRDSQAHFHGVHSLYKGDGYVVNPGGAGIRRSTNNGTSFASTSGGPTYVSAVGGIGDTLWGGRGYANPAGGTIGPDLTYSEDGGLTWDDDPEGPSTMGIGPRAVTGFLDPAGQRCFVSCNYWGGTWLRVFAAL